VVSGNKEDIFAKTTLARAEMWWDKFFRLVGYAVWHTEHKQLAKKDNWN
jgi:hypothetical protein